MKTQKNLFLLLAACCAVALAAPCRAAISVPSIFGDGMVLQQSADVRIWGRSDAAEVSLSASWCDTPLRTTVHDGQWEMLLKTPAGSFRPQRLVLSDGDSELQIDDVLIGEVWVCSGQSNMAMPLRGYTGQPVAEALETVLEASRYRDCIRMITLPCREAATPQYDFEAAWTRPDPVTTLDMSAVSYFFARALTQILDVPVGIISASWGGSKVEAWMSRPSLEALGYDIDKINGDSKISAYFKCTMLYNGLIAPVAGYGARGFLWYQGESNRYEAARYARMLKDMVGFWREQWHDAEAAMPFLYVQIAPYVYSKAAAEDAALLVEAQFDAEALIPNAEMISTTDVGDETCIHPAKKRVVGERLAVAALAHAYGMPMPDGGSVRMASVQFVEGKARVVFKNAQGGLTTSGGPVSGFEVAGDDGVFRPAQARIVNSESFVEVSSPEVPAPTAVRYAFRNYAPGNLCNTLGMPVIPFRSDRN